MFIIKFNVNIIMIHIIHITLFDSYTRTKSSTMFLITLPIIIYIFGYTKLVEHITIYRTRIFRINIFVEKNRDRIN